MCHGCLKASRLSPAAEQIMIDMEKNLVKSKLDDGTYKFTCRYVFNKDPQLAFPAERSNYLSALKQSRANYKQLMSSQIVARVKADKHFILQMSYFFLHQTTARKEIYKTTKLRHILNPSNPGKQSTNCLNTIQEPLPNKANKQSLCLSASTSYNKPYSSNVKSAYCKIGVHTDHQVFQLLILFDFAQENWEDHPLICLQEGLPFGSCQAGTFF